MACDIDDSLYSWRRFRRTRVSGVALATIAVLWTAPEVSHAAKFPDYPVRQATDYAFNAVESGISLGAEPVEDTRAQKIYFHMELTSKGFLPVFVVIQNRSTAESFLFDKTKVSYGVEEPGASTPQAGQKAATAVAITSLIAISYVGAFVAMKMITDASKIQQDILLKEVQSKTLSPGVSVHGFLYVPVPKKDARQKIHLRVPITRAATDDQIDLDLVF